MKKDQLKKLSSAKLLIVETIVFHLEYRQWSQQFPPWFRSLFVSCSLAIILLGILPINPISFVIAFGAGFAIVFNLKSMLDFKNKHIREEKI